MNRMIGSVRGLRVREEEPASSNNSIPAAPPIAKHR